MFAVFIYVDDTYRLAFKPDPPERPALVADARVTVPKYYGPSGWLAVDLNNMTDWNEIIELVEASYLLTAAKPRRRAAGADRR